MININKMIGSDWKFSSGEANESVKPTPESMEYGINSLKEGAKWLWEKLTNWNNS